MKGHSVDVLKTSITFKRKQSLGAQGHHQIVPVHHNTFRNVLSILYRSLRTFAHCSFSKRSQSCAKNGDWHDCTQHDAYHGHGLGLVPSQQK